MMAIVALIAAAVFACGDSDDDASTMGSGGSSADGGGGNATGGGTGRGRGTVTLSNGSNQHSYSAVFSATQDGAPPCTSTPEGACNILVCGTDGSGGAGGMPEPPTPPHAGDVTISVGGTTLTLTPDADGAYTAGVGTGSLLMGGETITVAAAGDTVPAFTGDVTAPSVVTVTEPDFDMMGAVTIDRAADLNVVWTDGATGDVFVVVSATGPMYTQVGCTFPASAGAGTVPAATLSALPSSPNGIFAVSANGSAEVTAGDFDVSLQVNQAASADSGPTGNASGTAVIN